MLVARMGDKLYGLFMSFAAIPRLGGLGDMGVSGAISLRTAQMIGRGEHDRLRTFLASARAFVLILSLLLSGLFFLLSPWLPGWFGFESSPGAGSLVILFQTGAAVLLLMVGGGYVYSVNFGFGNVLWPIMPLMLLAQAALFGHWLLAGHQHPLWVQNLPYLASSLLSLLVVWWLLRAAHPWLAELWPLRINLADWKELLSTSGWMYLFSIGNFVFTMTDRLLINAVIGSSAVPSYLFNYKPVELALQVVAAACVAAISKLYQWIANSSAASQARARQELERLSFFQNAFGVMAALAYLNLNDAFIARWVGDAYRAPMVLQYAFALTLAITAGGDALVQAAGMCGPNGLRTGAFAMVSSAVINFGLSFYAVQQSSVAGVAFATVLAQSLLSLTLARHTCSHLGLPYFSSVLKIWVLPVLGVSLGVYFRTSFTNIPALVGANAALCLILLWALGARRSLISNELKILRSFFRW